MHLNAKSPPSCVPPYMSLIHLCSLNLSGSNDKLLCFFVQNFIWNSTNWRMRKKGGGMGEERLGEGGGGKGGGKVR